MKGRKWKRYGSHYNIISPTEACFIFFSLKSLYLRVQLLLKVLCLSKYLAWQNVNIVALLSSMCCYLNYSIKYNLNFDFAWNWKLNENTDPEVNFYPLALLASMCPFPEFKDTWRHRREGSPGTDTLLASHIWDTVRYFENVNLSTLTTILKPDINKFIYTWD